MNIELAEQLVAMAAQDQQVRGELLQDGTLFEGYNPRMEAVHVKNAAALTKILDQYGWPGLSLVGEEGENAAWLVLQNAIGDPTLQRRGQALLIEAANKGEAPALQVAMITDRIRFNEGKPQVYGLMYDWTPEGQMDIYETEDLEHVDERRQAVGLPPLEDDIREMRTRVIDSGEVKPPDMAQRNQEMHNWYVSKGWRN